MKLLNTRHKTQRHKDTRAQRHKIFTCVMYHVICVMCLVSCVLISGCGYTTKSILPKSIQTIYVEPFKNDIDYANETRRNIYLPLLEVDARNAVIDRFLFDGNLKITEPETADLILRGNLNNYARTALRFTDNDDVEEYRIHISVSFELYNPKKDEISWTEPGFTGEATFFLRGSEVTSEESAIDKAILDLARRIVERTIEDW